MSELMPSGNSASAQGACFGIGIDLGGTHLRAGLIDLSGNIRAENSILSPHTTLEAFEKAVQKVIVELEEVTGIDDEDVTHLVIGVPGVVEPETGMISLCPNLPYLNGVFLQKYLEKLLKKTVIVENDVNIAAIGEQEISGSEDFVFIALGTGLGMAIFRNGEINRGSSGNAGEIGSIRNHLATEISNNDDKILEEIVSGAALEAKYQLVVGVAKNSESIFEMAEKDDPVAVKLISEMADVLARIIQNLIYILDPSKIILGGGIGSRETFMDYLAKSKFIEDRFRESIHFSSLGSRAGLVGALAQSLRLMRENILLEISNREDTNG
jgi:predicted NBD/HSP70 family sugar kinase